MLTEDYIMRMISQALAVLMIALGLKKAGQYNEAIQSFDQAIEVLLGLNAYLAKQLEDTALLELLTFQGRLDIDRVLVLARIYDEQSQIYTLQGQDDNSQFALQRSLRLYLEAALASKETLDLDVVQKIEALRTKISITALPVETRLALMDYLERLLGMSDDFLAQADVSRQKLRIDFSTIEGMDLH